MSEQEGIGESKKSCYCLNCLKPAVWSGENEITCEHCDSVYKVQKKQAKMASAGILDRVKKLEDVIGGLVPDQKEQGEPEPDGEKDKGEPEPKDKGGGGDDPFEFQRN